MTPSLVARSVGVTALALPLVGLLWVGSAQSAQVSVQTSIPSGATATMDPASFLQIGADIQQTERALRAVQRDLLHLAQSNYGITDPNAIERRFAALEQEVQRLTGQIERLGFQQRQMADRLERMQADMEYRLTQLEGGSPAAGGSTTGSFDNSSGASGSFDNSAGQTQAGTGGVQTLGSVSAQELQQLQGLGQGQTASAGQSSTSSGTFTSQQNFQTGALSGSTLGSQQTAPAQSAPTQAATASLPSGSAEDQYNYAFGLLRKADYQGAEQALKAFVQNNPNDPLVANAKYWLGETYYVRGNYDGASQAFAQAYQDHQNGPKAADSLLKLGLSLSLLGRTNEACQVLQELQVRMGSSARANILNRGRREQTNLGC